MIDSGYLWRLSLRCVAHLSRVPKFGPLCCCHRTINNCELPKYRTSLICTSYGSRAPKLELWALASSTHEWSWINSQDYSLRDVDDDFWRDGFLGQPAGGNRHSDERHVDAQWCGELQCFRLTRVNKQPPLYPGIAMDSRSSVLTTFFLFKISDLTHLWNEGHVGSSDLSISH